MKEVPSSNLLPQLYLVGLGQPIFTFTLEDYSEGEMERGRTWYISHKLLGEEAR